MTTVNEVLNTQNLPPFPMRAWLHHETAKNTYFADYTLFYSWDAPIEEPGLCFRNLRVADFGGAMCYVLHGKAVKPLHGRWTMTDDDEVEFMYVLNPSDPAVKSAVESWISRQVGTQRLGRGGGGYGGSISIAAKELARGESESDVVRKARSASLASVLLQLVQEGRLEKELASMLDIERPVYCTIVESELMLSALATQAPSA